MKTLLALLLLTSTPALAYTDLDGWVSQTHNVRYSEVQKYSDGGYKVYVIWYDDEDLEFPINTLCNLKGDHGEVRWVEWGTLGDYLKWHRDVSSAASTLHRCK